MVGPGLSIRGVEVGLGQAGIGYAHTLDNCFLA